jgi:hypothetical protein
MASEPAVGFVEPVQGLRQRRHVVKHVSGEVGHGLILRGERLVLTV